MSMRGRPPKPNEVKELEGNPGKRPLKSEPDVTCKLPPCPKSLGPLAKHEWRRIGKLMLEANMISQLDMGLLAAYCDSYEQWMKATEYINDHNLVYQTPSGYAQQNPFVSIAQSYAKQMHKFAEQLGLTPASRNRIGTIKSETSEDEMEQLLRGN